MLIAATALSSHAWVASARSAGLLEHDEAIALMTSAGKSQLAEQFYRRVDRLRVCTASELQSFMRPTNDTGFGDVLTSLARFDIHPPLYFVALRALQVIGLESQTMLRLFGSAALLFAAWAADRWLWHDASPWVRVVAALWLTLSPTMLEVGTQLRQYSLVYLGVMLTFAGLNSLGQATSHPQRGVGLLVAGPVLLLYAQFGMATWIAVLTLIAFLVAIRGTPVDRHRVIAAVALTALAVAPVSAWWMFKASSLGPSPAIPFNQWYGEAISPVADALGRSWISIPARWKDWGIGPIASCLLIISCAAFAVRGARLDRMIAGACAAWAVLWLALLLMGKAPPHAVTAKYLSPLVLGSFILVIRAALGSQSNTVRQVARILLVASCLLHVIGVRQQLQRSTSEPIVTELAGTDCLLVNVPRRGHLLPLVAPMRPEARVIVCGPDEAVAAWSDLEPFLPPGGVTLAVIRQDQAVDATGLIQKLEEKYGAGNVLRRETVRTLIAFHPSQQAKSAN